MTIEELKVKKSQLENSIKDLLNTFESETNTTVSYVNISVINSDDKQGNSSVIINSVTCEITL